MGIKVDLKIFIFIIIICLMKKIEIYVMLMSFALIHELAHLASGILVGFKPESIKISPYGFSINFKTNCKDYNTKIKKSNLLSLKKILIALSGPAINILIAIVLFLFCKVKSVNSIIGIRVEPMIYSNILLFLFNLIPIYPLDGGRILKELIHINMGLEKSYYITNEISNISIIILTIASSFLILIYHNIIIVFIIAYLWTLIIINNKNVKKIKKIITIHNLYKI